MVFVLTDEAEVSSIFTTIIIIINNIIINILSVVAPCLVVVVEDFLGAVSHLSLI